MRTLAPPPPLPPPPPTPIILSPQHQQLLQSLEIYGFGPPADHLLAWTDETIALIQETLASWDEDRRQTTLGTAILETSRAPVPRELIPFEAVTATTACQARDTGRTAASDEISINCNPYPPATALNKIWEQAHAATTEVLKEYTRKRK